MKLTLGFSPCPNDTFIFDAMVHGKIDTEGLTFEVIMEDVEALNQRAFATSLDITKLSYHAFAYTVSQYALLDAGSALGEQCGPLLIARQPIPHADLAHARIAIPGNYTTANFLLSIAFPHARHRYETVFSAIEDEVLSGNADAGLIIHENRFTYQAKGLVKLLDLGEYWETLTALPIPLGGIAVRRKLDAPTQARVQRVMRRSVAYALAHPEQTMNFVRPHAQAMDATVMQQHIALYVNDYTLDLGERGRAAIEALFARARTQGVIPASDLPLFAAREAI